MLLGIGIVIATGDDEPSIEDVPVGLADLAIEVARTDESVTIAAPGRSATSTVVVCPGLVAGPSDAPGIRERVRVSGCVGARLDPTGQTGAWTLSFAALDPDRIAALDAAERWLVVVADPDRAADDPAALAGAWIAGGPLLPTGPLLP